MAYSSLFCLTSSCILNNIFLISGELCLGLFQILEVELRWIHNTSKPLCIESHPVEVFNLQK